MKCFAIYDSKAVAYLIPFFSKNEHTAIRDFAHAANDQSHAFHRNAADYTLFELGEYDEQDGLIMQHDAVKPLGTALQFIEPPEPPKANGGLTKPNWNDLAGASIEEMRAALKTEETTNGN